MERSDLENYEYQLKQVTVALEKDPSNTEYSTLKDELVSLIELTKQYLSQQASSSKSAPSAQTTTKAPTAPHAGDPAAGSKAAPGASSGPALKAGEECQARWSGDGRFYPAKIASISGSDDNRVYSVIFKGYDNTEIVPQADVKPLSESRKRALEREQEEAEKDRKRRRNEKKAESRQQKTAEQGARQKTWQSFTKKATKKGVHIPGVEGASMFASPDNPHGKVGVVGSGKGMTSVSAPKRQVFRDDEEGRR